jgi:hypothetical protein
MFEVQPVPLAAMEVRAWMRQQPSGGWVAGWLDDEDPVAIGSTRGSCLEALKAAVGAQDYSLIIEVLPRLAGVAEAAQVMEWDKRRVVTYATRGNFPEPVQSLASGRVWLREDIERFAEEWRARRARRRDGDRT